MKSTPFHSLFNLSNREPHYFLLLFMVGSTMSINTHSLHTTILQTVHNVIALLGTSSQTLRQASENLTIFYYYLW